MTGKLKQAEKTIRVSGAVAIVGAMACLYLLTPVGKALHSPYHRQQLINLIVSRVHSTGMFNPLVFISVYSVLITLAFPGFLLSTAGCLLYAKPACMVLNLVGSTLGAALSFLLARYLVGDLLLKPFAGKTKALDRLMKHNGFLVIFYLRLLRFPFVLLNYLAGLVSVHLADFMAGTFLGLAPHIIILSFFLGTIKENLEKFHGWKSLANPAVLISGLLLLLSGALPVIILKLRNKSNKGSGGPSFKI